MAASVACLLLAVCCYLFLIPKPVVYRVTGFSMAPTLYGCHWVLKCLQCQITIKVPLDFTNQSFTCWHCGATVLTPSRSREKLDCQEEHLKTGGLSRDRSDLEPIRKKGLTLGGLRITLGGPRIATETTNDFQQVDFDRGDLVEGDLVEGDLVQLTPLAGEHGLQRGDLVAVLVDGRLRIKRIAALPGDSLSIDQSRLLVNQRRLEDWLQSSKTTPMPLLCVDEDQHRSISRWQPSSGDSGWHRQNRQWRFEHQHVANDAANAAETNGRKTLDPRWLVYHHHAVYDGSPASPIWDDYPFNVGVTRQMAGVDRLQLRLLVDAAKPVTVDVAYWIDQRCVVVSQTLLPGKRADIVLGESLDSSTGKVDLKTSPEITLSETSPVAIRFHATSAELTELVLMRSVEYRLRKSDSRAIYPLRLGPQQYFVLGDNVPISVDSRSFGPVACEQILGSVTRHPH